jgi:hypothetical protein
LALNLSLFLPQAPRILQVTSDTTHANSVIQPLNFTVGILLNRPLLLSSCFFSFSYITVLVRVPLMDLQGPTTSYVLPVSLSLPYYALSGFVPIAAFSCVIQGTNFTVPTITMTNAPGIDFSTPRLVGSPVISPALVNTSLHSANIMVSLQVDFPYNLTGCMVSDLFGCSPVVSLLSILLFCFCFLGCLQLLKSCLSIEALSQSLAAAAAAECKCLAVCVILHAVRGDRQCQQCDRKCLERFSIQRSGTQLLVQHHCTCLHAHGKLHVWLHNVLSGLKRRV